MKWLRRSILLIILLPLFLLAAAWVFFPLLAPPLLAPVLEAPGRHITLSGLHRPTFGGISCDSVSAQIELPPGACATDTQSTAYLATFRNPRIAWQADLQALRLTFSADSLSVGDARGAFRLSDSDAEIALEGRLSLTGPGAPGFTPLSASYALSDATLEAGSMRAEGIAFPLALEAASGWAPSKATFSIERALNAGSPLPISALRATLESLPDSTNSCTLSLSDCSLALLGMELSTDTISYDMRRRRASFTLEVRNADAERMLTKEGDKTNMPFATGTLYGTIPVLYADSVLTVSGGTIGATKKAALHWYDRTNTEWLSLDMGDGPILKNLRTEMVVGTPSGPDIRSLSADIFGGQMSARSAMAASAGAPKPLLVSLKGVEALQAVKFHGTFKGALKGAVYGTVPVTFEPEGFAVRGATLRSAGGGTLTMTDPETREEASYEIGEPAAVLSRYPSGALTLDVSMKEMKRRAAGGELLLTHPAGRIMLWHDHSSPDLVQLRGFSAGFFNSTLSIAEADYDLGTRKGSTVLRFSSLPLQKLLEMQGTKKLYATGTLQGDVPVAMDGSIFSIENGGMRSEQSGQIIYATTAEERAAANPGLRTTYEALTNFLYIKLDSSLDMAPSGDSVIAIHLRGSNPDYQGGRPVEINLTIRQNLLDLWKSLSISTDIERTISEKALRQQKR